MTQSIQIFDPKEKRILHIKIHADNYVSRQYLMGHFAGLTGLTYEDSNGNVFGVPVNENNDFIDDWNANAQFIYKPVFANSRRSSQTSISWTERICHWLTASGALFSSSPSVKYEKVD